MDETPKPKHHDADSVSLDAADHAPDDADGAPFDAAPELHPTADGSPAA